MNLSDKDDILFPWFQKEENNRGSQNDHIPHFMIFIDKSTKSIVLAIRGTSSIKDAVINAVASETKFLNGYAHKGIFESSQKILHQSSQVLKKAFENYPEYRLIITGHSLGGGTGDSF